MKHLGYAIGARAASPAKAPEWPVVCNIPMHVHVFASVTLPSVPVRLAVPTTIGGFLFISHHQHHSNTRLSKQKQRVVSRCKKKPKPHGWRKTTTNYQYSPVKVL